MAIDGGSIFNGKPDPVGDKADNELYAMIGEILIGFGLIVQMAGWFTQSWLSWYTYVGEFFTLGAIGVWVWGVLKYNDARVEPTAATTYRSWRVNFIAIWLAVGVSIFNIGLAFTGYLLSAAITVISSIFTGTSTNALSIWGMIIAAFVGAAAVGVGAYFAYFIKNLWYNYDDSGSKLDDDFDFFKWSDREDEDAIFLAELSAVEF